MGQMGLKKGISGILTSVSNKNWVEQVVEEALEKSIKSPQITEFFHPSWSGDCPRLIQLNMFGLVKSTIDYKTQRIFDNGNSMHERYSGYFKKAKKLVNEEVSFELLYKGIKVSGRADIIVHDYNGKKNVGEMKSINDRRFTELLISNCPREEHFLQWNIYSKGLNIQNGFVLYENKNDQRIQVFLVSFDEERFNQVMNKFLFINECNKQGKLVPKPDPCPDGRYCPAVSFCKNDAEGQKVFNSAITEIMLKKLEKSK